MTHSHTPDAPPADAPAARSWPSTLLVLPGLAALTLVAALAACEGDGASVAAASASTDSLVQPIEIRSVGGVLDVTLEALVETLPVPGSTGTTDEVLRTYRLLAANGVSYADSNKVGFPGPTFRVAQGDSVRILLINNLPADTAGCMAYPAAQPRGNLPPVDVMEDCFHGPNSTNLHFHGFHISPDSGADNVLMQVAPGDSFQYAFRIPMDQSPGTHWYHPHKHGSVALQVTNGMSGAFIVEGSGGLDSLTRAMNMREVLVAVQEIDPSMNLVDSSVAQAKLVNGQYQPTLDMRPGEVIRMRLVNENVARTASYNLVFSQNPSDSAPQLYDVARDGVQYAPANYDTTTPDTSLFVAPGNRLDMFVRAPTQAGTHELQTVVTPGPTNSRKGENLPIAREQTVLRVRVRGEAGTGYATTLPGALPPLPDFLANLDTSIVAVSHSIVFTDSGGTRGAKQNPNPPSFFLGTTDSVYQKFDSDVTMIQMPVNTTQVWMVYNRSPNQLNHPFHIHINPFQVDSVFAPDSTDPNYDYYQTLNAASARGNPIWLDVLALPRPDANGNEGWVRIRQRYVRFTGPFVMHCHILGHEERGMMQRIAIVDGALPPTAQAASGARGGRTTAGGGGSGTGGGRPAPASTQDEHAPGHSH